MLGPSRTALSQPLLTRPTLSILLAVNAVTIHGDGYSSFFAHIWKSECRGRADPSLHGSPPHNSKDGDRHQVGKHLHYISRYHVEHAAQYLGLRDQDVGETEEVSATQQLYRVPSGENNQRQSHPTAACRHTFCPRAEIRD